MQAERKKIHREVVSFLRKFNKSIKNDEYLGINRFEIKMIREDWHRYEDGSGGYLSVLFKIYDNETGNSASFPSNNYNYKNMIVYVNDFMIRCSSGMYGCFPHLNYISYDIHTIKEYSGSKNPWNGKLEEGVLGTYQYD